MPKNSTNIQTNNFYFIYLIFDDGQGLDARFVIAETLSPVWGRGIISKTNTAYQNTITARYIKSTSCATKMAQSRKIYRDTDGPE